MPCVICEKNSPLIETDSPQFRVAICAHCGHRTAEFFDGRAAGLDYYENTSNLRAFVTSLEQTRRRQAKKIIQKAQEVLGGVDQWIDYGCGRGWFLDALIEVRAHQIGGFDSSDLSMDWLKRKNIAAVRPSAQNKFRADWSSLPFASKILSFLDVIEHFPGAEVFSVVQEALRKISSLEWLIIKVPNSQGALFQIAKSIRTAFPAPYAQLFQVGTYPPHFHYFSPASILGWGERLGLKPMAEFSDPDYDRLFDRISFLQNKPGEFLLRPLLRVLPNDTKILFFRVQR